MYCLENMERISYPASLVMDLTTLYSYKGKDFYFDNLFKNEMNTIIKDTIEHETFFAARALKLQVSENRLRQIIRKNGTPKTNDEKILFNLKEVFSIIQSKGSELELTSNEFLALAKRLFSDIKEVGYAGRNVEVQVNLLREKRWESFRKEFERLLDIYKNALVNKQVEATQLATNLYVDIYNLKVFNQENEFLSLLIYYCLLYKEGFKLFKYVSFFEMYNDHEEEFRNAIVSASFNWETGFAQTAILNSLTLKLMLSGYEKIEAKSSAYKFDKTVKKIDSVGSSILKLGEIFTKEEIRAANPYLSDSTINRALETLKKENKIRPNGTGRSATWIRIVDDEPFDPRNRQMTLFELIMDNDKED